MKIKNINSAYGDQVVFVGKNFHECVRKMATTIVVNGPGKIGKIPKIELHVNNFEILRLINNLQNYLHEGKDFEII